MSRLNDRLLQCALVVFLAVAVRAGEPIEIVGNEQNKLDLSRTDGGLDPVEGVANVQGFRASWGAPEWSDGKGWTYHHHVDIGCWKGKLYVAWDSCEKDEDVGISRELYSTSND